MGRTDKFRLERLPASLLVEVAVRFENRAIRVLSDTGSPPLILVLQQPGGGRPSKNQTKPFRLRNEAPLNFVSLRSSLHFVGLRGLSRVMMNAQKRAPLTALSQPE